MELKNRQTSILRGLLRSGEGMAIKDLMDSYEIARRTLYYDVKKIDDWLMEGRLGSMKIQGQIVSVQITDDKRLEKKLRQRQSYFFSVTERHAMEIIFIALFHEAVTVQKLEDYFDVSRNTILTDIKEIRNKLEKNELALNTAVRSGYVIQGEEAAIRKMLGIQIRQLSNTEGRTAIKQMFQRSLTMLTGNDIDFYELCNSVIYQYEIDTKGECILSNIGYESLRIQMALIRSIKGFENHMSDEEKYILMNTLSYRSLEISAEKLKIHNIIIPSSEIYYITSLLLGIQTVDFLSQNWEDSYIEKICVKLIANFERIGCLFLTDREHLHKQLMHHVRPLYYRLKYAVSANNPMVKDIKRMYPMVFEITQRAFGELGSAFPEKVSDEELAYICVYMASNLNEKMIELSNERTEKGILIIGAENMATATMVKEQLQQLLGITFKYSVTSSSKIREWVLEEYMLVVAVGALKNEISCDYLVRTEPVLTEADQKRIIDILKGNHAIARYDRKINDIISIAGRNTSGAIEKSNLYFELFRYFRGNESGNTKEVSVDLFKDKIKKEDFVFLPQYTSWERAVLTGGRCLQPGEGSLCGRLGNLMARGKVHIYRMHRKVMLVHCPMQGDEDGKVDVVIMVSGQGIECPDGKKSHIIVCLSTIDNYAHWGLLWTIYRYFETDSHVEGILKCYEEEKEWKGEDEEI